MGVPATPCLEIGIQQELQGPSYDNERAYRGMIFDLGCVTQHRGSCAVRQVAEVRLVASRVLQNPVQLGLLCTSLCQCFEFDGPAAGLLLHAPQEGGTHVAQPARRIEAGCAEGAIADNAEERQPNEDQQSERTQAALSTILLPRMPVGLSHMSSQAAYDAVAGIARTAGRVASMAGDMTCQANGACMALLVLRQVNIRLGCCGKAMKRQPLRGL